MQTSAALRSVFGFREKISPLRERSVMRTCFSETPTITHKGKIMESGSIIEMDEGVFYHTMGDKGYVGMMHHRDIGWSTIAVFEHPERDLCRGRVVEGEEKEELTRQLRAIEAAIADGSCNFIVNYEDKMKMLNKPEEF